jgi:methionyl-tRNA formyltransferase
MRIAVIGQAAFGAKSLESLLEKGENIVAAYAPPDRPGGKRDPLAEAASARGIPLFQPASFKDDRVFSDFRAFEPDLAILAFVTAIIPPRYFEACSRGAICYHPSLLPRRRGASAINWAVALGDERTGLTIFWPDGGIDTGPILLQKEVEIGPEDTTGSLYFNHLFPMGIEAIRESVDLIRRGAAPKIPQPAEGASYEPIFDDRWAGVDWNKPGREICNLIRGCDPQPGAYVNWMGGKVRLHGAKFSPATGESGPPGALLELGAGAVRIAVPGGELTIEKVRAAGVGKISASAFAAGAGFRIGDFFGEKSHA